jgi:very-short-patch-repair endonuclease
MKVKDLNGNTHSWSLTGHLSHGRIENKSSYHLNARQLLKQIFPTLQILEEVPINVRKNEILYLDFYLPLKKICIEVHGEQHYKFIPFYHKTLLDFSKAKKRDTEKQEWCQTNGISYISLPHFETLLEWENKLKCL